MALNPGLSGMRKEATLKLFEMSRWRSVLKISWTERIFHVKVLNRVGGKKSWLDLLWKGEAIWLATCYEGRSGSGEHQEVHELRKRRKKVCGGKRLSTERKK